MYKILQQLTDSLLMTACFYGTAYFLTVLLFKKHTRKTHLGGENSAAASSELHYFPGCIFVLEAQLLLLWMAGRHLSSTP